MMQMKKILLRGIIKLENSKSKFAKACQEYVNSGKCIGDCCGCIVIPKIIWDKHQDKIQTIPKEVKVGLDTDKTEIVFPTTEDFKCPFLNKQTFGCMIYDDRPTVCRDFGTDKENILLQCPHLKLNGNIKNEAQKKIHYRKADQLIKNKMNQIDRSLAEGEEKNQNGIRKNIR